MASVYGGCFSKVMRVEERWATKIPENVPTEVACPLLCGGGIVFEAVCDYIECGASVAVASIGGLGTTAIKFSRSFGGHVKPFLALRSRRKSVWVWELKTFEPALVIQKR